MKKEKYENRKQLISAGIWSLAVLCVLAVGMLTFFSSASRATKEQDKRGGETVVTDAGERLTQKDKTPAKGNSTPVTEAEADTEAGFFKPANPLDTDVPGAKETPADETADAKDADAAPDAPTGADVVAGAANFRCSMPIDGTVTKDFTDDIAVYSLTMNDYRVHNGIDIYAPVGTNVKACAAGTVERVWEDPFLGSCVEINHGGGVKSLYANLSSEFPRGMEAGATVLAGDVIGGVGSSMIIEMADTDHLHFAVSVDGVHVDPLDYMTGYRETPVGDYEN